ncbi:hypothetical protein IV500_16915 [Paeniglutamicibacter antarcticus]|uniref:Uncharacterized protein n=1 Tax=Arthrobacter terrae TaxID=2935737 RepID=A0A931G5N8_9MICC|nr:hypothetical protein [Arthrobacter terrae]
METQILRIPGAGPVHRVYPFDGGYDLRVGEVAGVEGLAEPFPVAVQDEQELFASEGGVVV